MNYGLRYSATFGLLDASGRTQQDNAAYITLKALNIPLVTGVPRDDRKQFGPRLGIWTWPRAAEPCRDSGLTARAPLPGRAAGSRIWRAGKKSVTSRKRA